MLWACNFETTDGSSTLCTVETGMRSVELSSTLREEDLWLAWDHRSTGLSGQDRRRLSTLDRPRPSTDTTISSLKQAVPAFKATWPSMSVRVNRTLELFTANKTRNSKVIWEKAKSLITLECATTFPDKNCFFSWAQTAITSRPFNTFLLHLMYGFGWWPLCAFTYHIYLLTYSNSADSSWMFMLQVRDPEHAGERDRVSGVLLPHVGLSHGHTGGVGTLKVWAHWRCSSKWLVSSTWSSGQSMVTRATSGSREPWPSLTCSPATRSVKYSMSSNPQIYTTI